MHNFHIFGMLCDLTSLLSTYACFRLYGRIFLIRLPLSLSRLTNPTFFLSFSLSVHLANLLLLSFFLLLSIYFSIIPSPLLSCFLSLSLYIAFHSLFLNILSLSPSPLFDIKANLYSNENSTDRRTRKPVEAPRIEYCNSQNYFLKHYVVRKRYATGKAETKSTILLFNGLNQFIHDRNKDKVRTAKAFGLIPREHQGSNGPRT